MHLVQLLSEVYANNKKNINLFFVCLILALVAYGPKLFFQSYASDDYANYMIEPSWYYFNSWLGRWAGSLLNHFFFSANQHVLPYFNSVLAISLLVATGIVVSLTWEIKQRVPIALISLLIALSPYWANNLWFNVNTGVSIGLLVSAIAIWMLCNKNTWPYYLLATLLLAIGAGIYQPIVEAVGIIVIGQLYIRLINADNLESLKRVFFQFSLLSGIVIIANVISIGINQLTLSIADTTVREGARYDEALSLPLRDILYLVCLLYTSPSPRDRG